jgi:hypothetical protein
MPKSPNITTKQNEAILALLTNSSIKLASKACGVSERALRNWLRLPAFREEYYQARSESFQHALGQVSEILVAGAIVLRKIILDETASASVRVAAVRTAFDIAGKDLDLHELQGKVAHLEDMLKLIREAA